MRFDWRTSVSKLTTDLSCAITSILHSTSRSALCDDSEWLDKTGVIRSVPVVADVIDFGSDRPNQVSAVSIFLIYPKFLNSGCFHILRFIDSECFECYWTSLLTVSALSAIGQVSWQ